MKKSSYSALKNDGNGTYSQELLQALVENLLPGIQVLKVETNGSDDTIDFRFAFSDKTIPEQDGKPEGEKLSRLFPATKENGLHEFLVNAKKQGIVFNEVIHHNGNGKKGWTHLKIQSFGEGLLISKEDITEIKKAEEKIFQLNRELALVNSELQTFNSIAANDYKETLKHLYTNLEYIVSHDAAGLSDTGKANLRKAQSAIQRMKLLTEDIVTYTAIHSLGTEIETVELNKILEGVRQDMAKKINKENLNIECDSLPLIKGYPVLISLLFQHLLDNAIKFRKETGEVSITISCSEEESDKINHPEAAPGSRYSVIAVKDEGIGFELEQKDEIFNIFHKLNGKKYRGSGIGLAISKKIMDMNGGFIAAESEPGKGTTIRCYFPK